MNINVSISKKAYKIKPTSTEISKMVFQSTTISLEVFSELIKNGYNYTHLFNTSNPQFTTSEKKENNFKSTCMVVLDIDNANKPLNAFVGRLTYVPTIAYTSPSNNNSKQIYKCRLVYIFNEPIINAEQYESIYWNLVHQMESDNGFINDDNRVRNVSYYFNGSYGCDIINDFSKIYKFSDFLIQNNNVNETSLYINLNKKKINTTIKTKISINKVFLKDLNTLEPFEFLKKYKSIYPIIENTPIEFNNGYAMLDEDYIEIKRKWTWGSLETENGLSKLYTITKKLKDGQGRRYHIGLAAMLRRKILPTITLEHLIVNAVYDRQYYYDNSDGELTNKVLIERCSYVMNLKEITIKTYNKKKYKVDKSFWVEKGINPNQAKNIVRKKINFENIARWYDTSISLKENLQIALDSDIKVSRDTLYRFCKEYNINTNPNKGKKNNVTKCNTTIDNIDYIEPLKNDVNLDLINEINTLYESQNFLIQNNNVKNILINNTETMVKEEFLNKVDVMIDKLSNINNKDLLTTNYNKAVKWITDRIYKYQLNVDRESIVSNVTNVYESTMKQLNDKSESNTNNTCWRN